MKKKLLTTLTITAAMTFSVPEKINIDAGVYDLRVETSQSGNAEIEYVGPEKYLPIIRYDAEDKILNISQAPEEVVNKEPEEYYKCDLTLKIPRESLQKFDAKLAVGEIIIEELTADDIDIETGTGNVSIREIEGSQIDITSAVGEVAVYNATFDDIRVNAAIGDVTLETEKNTYDYDIQIKTGLGNTYVEDKPVTSEFTNEGTKGSIIIVDELGSVNLYSENPGGQAGSLGAIGFWSIIRSEG